MWERKWTWVPSDDDFSGYDAIVDPHALPAAAWDRFPVRNSLLKEAASCWQPILPDMWMIICFGFHGRFPGNGLSEPFGIISEEIDTCIPPIETTNPFRERLKSGG